MGVFNELLDSDGFMEDPEERQAAELRRGEKAIKKHKKPATSIDGRSARMRLAFFSTLLFLVIAAAVLCLVYFGVQLFIS